MNVFHFDYSYYSLINLLAYYYYWRLDWNFSYNSQVTHSQQHACPKCSFITNIEEELRDHVQEAHGVDDFMEMLSDEEVKTPKTNAQGKVRTI